MTPKEKVSELMQRFQYHTTDGELPQPITRDEAIELALFVCEQVIEQDTAWTKATGTTGGHFWRMVRLELEKLKNGNNLK